MHKMLHVFVYIHELMSTDSQTQSYVSYSLKGFIYNICTQLRYCSKSEHYLLFY